MQDDDFSQRIKRFVATKADLLFSMEGKQKLQRGVDFGLHSNQEGKCTLILRTHRAWSSCAAILPAAYMAVLPGILLVINAGNGNIVGLFYWHACKVELKATSQVHV